MDNLVSLCGECHAGVEHQGSLGQWLDIVGTDANKPLRFVPHGTQKALAGHAERVI